MLTRTLLTQTTFALLVSSTLSLPLFAAAAGSAEASDQVPSTAELEQAREALRAANKAWRDLGFSISTQEEGDRRSDEMDRALADARVAEDRLKDLEQRRAAALLAAVAEYEQAETEELSYLAQLDKNENLPTSEELQMGQEKELRTERARAKVSALDPKFVFRRPRSAALDNDASWSF